MESRLSILERALNKYQIHFLDDHIDDDWKATSEAIEEAMQEYAENYHAERVGKPTTEPSALPIAGVEARFCDLPIGAKYKYHKDDEGVFTIIRREKYITRTQRHCGRFSSEIDDDKTVYPV